jgi:predicted O-methyltransferase YrrM
VDVDAFARALPGLWDDFPRSELPRDPFFAELLDAVGGLARPNNLALLAAASAARDAAESYVEIGAFKGASAIAAAHGCPRDVVTIDNFAMEGAERDILERNLHAFGCDDVTVLEGDAFELLHGGAIGERRVGVYYYDARHKYEFQLEALRAIEPHLADRALLIVDDSDWPDVERATRDWLETQPRAKPLLWIDGKDKGMPWWWEGMCLIDWRSAR